ncbi:MAG TPA: 16S rRNA (cytidine(1402)-2'-O)-methyltransferase [Vicinamibacteria bacterium]|jgi:16S rRNA (cytidine1402-2'-O)-methyltransferase
MPATLYVVATPIGNLGDVSLRALEVLRSVALIACEDTRTTRTLLARHGIKTRTISYHEHNEKSRAAELASRLEGGDDIALVSDAGTPGISDPGYRLVAAARQKGIPVRAVPGPSAVLAALSVSGLPTSSFCFYGFLPRRGSARLQAIESLATSTRTAVLFESPQRARALLEELAERLGPRPAFLAREITKIHEEHRAGSLAELASWVREKPPRGELTLVIEGAPRRTTSLPAAAVQQRFAALTAQGLKRRQAVKVLAEETGLPSRLLYRRLLRPEAD